MTRGHGITWQMVAVESKHLGMLVWSQFDLAVLQGLLLAMVLQVLFTVVW